MRPVLLFPDRVFDSDPPDQPILLDGFSLLHVAYGVLATSALSDGWGARLAYWKVFLIVYFAAIAWEIVEYALHGRIGLLFGLRNYQGDSGDNMVADVAVAVLGWTFASAVPPPANWITGVVLLALGIGWTAARAYSKRAAPASASAPAEWIQMKTLGI